MNCPRCGSFVFREHDPYGGTEFLCIAGHSWMERVGVPITEDPSYRNHVRENGVKHRQPPRLTVKPAAEQDMSYELRQARERVRVRDRRLRLVK